MLNELLLRFLHLPLTVVRLAVFSLQLRTAEQWYGEKR